MDYTVRILNDSIRIEFDNNDEIILQIRYPATYGAILISERAWTSNSFTRRCNEALYELMKYLKLDFSDGTNEFYIEGNFSKETYEEFLNHLVEAIKSVLGGIEE